MMLDAFLELLTAHKSTSSRPLLRWCSVPRGQGGSRILFAKPERHESPGESILPHLMR